jgi:hypothetical protein
VGTASMDGDPVMSPHRGLPRLAAFSSFSAIALA